MKSFSIGLTLILCGALMSAARDANAQAQAARPTPPAETPPPVETPKPADTPAEPPAEPPPAAPTAAQTPAPPVTPPVVVPAPARHTWPFVTIDVDNPRAVLQRTKTPWNLVTAQRNPDSEEAAPVVRWETACAATCDDREDPDMVYRVGGRGVVASQPFRLPNVGRKVQVKGRVGGKGARIAGMVMTGVGLGNLALDSLLLSSDTSTDAYGNKTGPDQGLLTVGIVIAGLVALIGISLVLSNGTDVKVE